MIDKEEFYRGAALSLLLEDGRCESIKRTVKGGYLAHGSFFLVKYTTKGRSPWNFFIYDSEIERFRENGDGAGQKLLVLVCGGDGICVLKWEEILLLLEGRPGTIAVRRKHNTQYEVRGSSDRLSNKVPRNRWPGIVLDNVIGAALNE